MSKIVFDKLFRCDKCGTQLALRAEDFPITCHCGNRVETWVTESPPAPVRRMRPHQPSIHLYADGEEQHRRRSICESCPDGLYKEGYCSICPSCNNGRAESFSRYLSLATSRCPKGHWQRNEIERSDLKWFSTTQLIQDTLRLIPQLPHNLFAVCGVARSGMIPASILASTLHLPLFSVSEDKGVQYLGHGYRLEHSSSYENLSGPILVIDDSRGTGRSQRVISPIVRSHWTHHKLMYAVIYSYRDTLTKKPVPDLWVEELGRYHLFEWNLFNSPFFTDKIGYDFDGILCHDWPGNAEGDKWREEHDYQEWIDCAPPLHLPRRDEIPLLVSGRMEKHRAATERWLSKFGIKVKKLILWPGDSQERWARVPIEKGRSVTAVAEFKANYYKLSNLELFVESSIDQAQDIAILTGKPVLCPKAGKVF